MSKQGLSHRKLIVLSTTQEDRNEHFKNFRAVHVSTCAQIIDGKNCRLLKLLYSVECGLCILQLGVLLPF